MKNILLLVLFFYGLYSLSAQRLYVPPKVVNDTTYKHYVGLLWTSYYNDSIKPNISDKHQKWICYYHLNTIPDTVFKYMKEAMYFDAQYECWMMVETGATWTVRNRKLEPRREFIVKRFCDSVFRTYDSVLIRVLDTLTRNDDKYRKSMDDDPWIKGNEKKWIEQHILDSVNELKLAGIMDRKGYPGKNIVGFEKQNKAFMIIQHAELPYQERYLALVEKAVNDNQMDNSYWPMLIDRMNMRKGLPQIYGTQAVWNEKRKVLELYKMKSLKDADKLRAEYGLGKLSDYLMRNHYELPLGH